MKILIVTGMMEQGGAETHILELALGLRRLSHRVTVACCGGRLVKKLATHSVCVVLLPLDKKTPHSLLLCYKQLLCLVQKENFDILHAHTRISALLCHYVSRRCNIPMVTTMHARFDMKAPKDRLSRWGNGTIAVSDDLRTYLLRHTNDVLGDNVTVIPNGIDTHRFSPSKASQRDGKRIVFVSRLDADCSEAAYALCRIADRLAERFDGLDIVIAGGGSEYAKIRTLASRSRGRCVRAVGSVKDVRTVLCGADAFVGVSRAALEAMACKIPVILAGNEGFLGELTVQNLSTAAQSNFCCRGQDKLSDEKLFSAICGTLSRSSEQRALTCALLREHITSEHSIEKVVRQTVKLYKRVIDDFNGRASGGDILLCGYYGYGNMGDDALLLRASQKAQKKCAVGVCALTARGGRDSEKFGLRCASRKNIFCVLKEISNCQTVVFGGGTLLQNSTSARSLWYYLFILKYATLLGKRIELWGNGIGDIKGKHAAKITARLLSRCDHIGLRDEASYRVAKRLLESVGGTSDKLCLEADLACTPWELGETREASHISGIPDDTTFAVFALRGTEDCATLRAARDLVKTVIKRNVLPVYIAMYPKEDLTVCERFAARLGGKVLYPLGISDTVSLISQAQAVYGMRYHALVFAYTVGTPFVGISSQQKIKEFCKKYGGRWGVAFATAPKESKAWDNLN